MAMGRTQKIVTTSLWALAVVGMTGVVASGLWSRGQHDQQAAAVSVDAQGDDQAPGDLPVYFNAPAFALENENGKPITNEDLRGHPYIATFIFTHCAGSCPMMSSKMAKLQKLIPDRSVKLVSFTVDPQRDTPEVLKAYARQFDADETRWYFLTGSVQQMKDMVVGMKLVAEPQAGSDQVLHSTKFVLVDGQGRVRKTYDYDNDSDMLALPKDAQRLAESEGPAK